MYGVASDFGLFAEQLIAPATEPMRNHAQLDTDKQRRDNRSDANAAQSVQENQAVGFAALKETSPCAGEIYVMGVLPAYHRSGIGQQLFAAIRAEAIARGYRLLQVKTVQTGHYEEYDRTNAFYQRMGFLPLECLPTLWDEWNPCQVYVLPLQNS